MTEKLLFGKKKKTLQIAFFNSKKNCNYKKSLPILLSAGNLRPQGTTDSLQENEQEKRLII